MQVQGGVDVVESVALHDLSCSVGWIFGTSDHQNWLVSIEWYEGLHDSVCLDDLVLCDRHFEFSSEVLGASGFMFASTVGDEDVRDLLIAWIVAFQDLKRTFRFRKDVGPGFEYAIDVECKRYGLLQLRSFRQARCRGRQRTKLQR